MNASSLRALLRRLRPLALVPLCAVDVASADGWGLAGAEFNPVRAVLSASSLGEVDRTLSLTGGLRFAADGHGSEIAVPIGWYDYRTSDDGGFFVEDDFSLVEFDVQYRLFLGGNNRSGVYFGPLLHVARVSGTRRDDDEDTTARPTASAVRAGIGLVVGFRRTFANDYYWGMALSGGSFLDDSPDIESPLFGDIMAAGEGEGSAFLDFELFKIGRFF